MSTVEKPGYSAIVDLQLHVEGRVLPLAQVAPDFCVLKNQEDISSVAAEIVVIIDGQVQRRAVQLFPQSADDPRRVPLRGI